MASYVSSYNPGVVTTRHVGSSYQHTGPTTQHVTEYVGPATHQITQHNIDYTTGASSYRRLPSTTTTIASPHITSYGSRVPRTLSSYDFPLQRYVSASLPTTVRSTSISPLPTTTTTTTMKTSHGYPHVESLTYRSPTLTSTPYSVSRRQVSVPSVYRSSSISPVTSSYSSLPVHHSRVVSSGGLARPIVSPVTTPVSSRVSYSTGPASVTTVGHTIGKPVTVGYGAPVTSSYTRTSPSAHDLVTTYGTSNWVGGTDHMPVYRQMSSKGWSTASHGGLTRSVHYPSTNDHYHHSSSRSPLAPPLSRVSTACSPNGQMMDHFSNDDLKNDFTSSVKKGKKKKHRAVQRQYSP